MAAVKPLQQPLPGVPDAKKNIYQRINEVRKKATYVQKDKTVSGQNYKAMTHDAVTALLRNHLIDQGIVIVPRLIESSVVEIGRTEKGAQIIRYRQVRS